MAMMRMIQHSRCTLFDRLDQFCLMLEWLCMRDHRNAVTDPMHDIALIPSGSDNKVGVGRRLRFLKLVIHLPKTDIKEKTEEEKRRSCSAVDESHLDNFSMHRAIMVHRGISDMMSHLPVKLPITI